MLKLPKGLKKKKKGKKSKKNQELFTEEELENYKREQREKQQAEENSAKKPEDDEWSKFNALTTGIDTVLKRTQGDLDRIKEQSFFQRVQVPVSKSKVEKKLQEGPQQSNKEATKSAEEKLNQREEAAPAEEEEDNFAQAIVELSESEEESEEADDIFDTNYIDALTSGEVQLAYVPESPTELFDAGPDPFDTSYADSFVKETSVSKRGKKLVNIGSAVEVLTGRVERQAPLATARPHRGPQNLLLESFDENPSSATTGANQSTVQEEVVTPIQTLLDDPADDIPDIPIDLSVSLHLALQKEQKSEEPSNVEQKLDAITLSEFEQPSAEDDEFAELAAESLIKKEEVRRLSAAQPEAAVVNVVDGDWSAFQAEKDLPDLVNEFNVDECEFDVADDDPFNTSFVEKVIPPSIEEDNDFDPRAEDPNVVSVKPTSPEPPVPVIDLLTSIDDPDVSNIGHVPIIPTGDSIQEENLDPFDTSAIASIVQPKKTEIKFLEEELLFDKASLNDPDFDPRAEELKPDIQISAEALARRKSSLSLNIGNSTTTPKSVIFINAPDLLDSTTSGLGKIQKPLTPYYSQELPEDKEPEDPFDTSFVGNTNPSQVELSLLEKNLLTQTKLSHSLSDPDFDPRAESPQKSNTLGSDLLAVDEVHHFKVLTPAIDKKDSVTELSFDDPFDTSTVDHNIRPGKTELKLLESELLPKNKEIVEEISAVLDTYSDSQALGLGDKALTPFLSKPLTDFEEEKDPFDTSIADNLAPGVAEIKVLESEFIHQ